MKPAQLHKQTGICTLTVSCKLLAATVVGPHCIGMLLLLPQTGSKKHQWSCCFCEHNKGQEATTRRIKFTQQKHAMSLRLCRPAHLQTHLACSHKPQQTAVRNATPHHKQVLLPAFGEVHRASTHAQDTCACLGQYTIVNTLTLLLLPPRPQDSQKLVHRLPFTCGTSTHQQ